MNYEATARSNYFRVKDEAAFRKWAEDRCLDVVVNDDNVLVTGGPPQKLFMIYRSDGWCWPTSWWDEETQQDHECDVATELAAHLHPEDVAVLIQVGHEGTRCVDGGADAVNAAGATRHVNLDQIYELAKELGPHVTRAEY